MTDANVKRLMLYIFPEQFPKHLLIEKLKELNLGIELKPQDKDEDICDLFYRNMASLPRRQTRSNRRGKITKKIHLLEDKKTAVNIANLNKIGSNKSLLEVSQRSLSGKSFNYTKAPHTFANDQATPEMDRLLARSKTAVSAKRKKEDSILESRVKTVKLINTQEAALESVDNRILKKNNLAKDNKVSTYDKQPVMLTSSLKSSGRVRLKVTGINKHVKPVETKLITAEVEQSSNTVLSSAMNSAKTQSKNVIKLKKEIVAENVSMPKVHNTSEKLNCLHEAAVEPSAITQKKMPQTELHSVGGLVSKHESSTQVITNTQKVRRKLKRNSFLPADITENKIIKLI